MDSATRPGSNWHCLAHRRIQRARFRWFRCDNVNFVSFWSGKVHVGHVRSRLQTESMEEVFRPISCFQRSDVRSCALFSKVTMQPYLHTAKLLLERHSPCKVKWSPRIKIHYVIYSKQSSHITIRGCRYNRQPRDNPFGGARDHGRYLAGNICRQRTSAAEFSGSNRSIVLLVYFILYFFSPFSSLVVIVSL